ncbi:MAG: ATP-binding cassette subfamily C protein LapB [Paracoccaceae bacterium]|jgi:ATP-binding cassette subfamily C protein/ATP-binding cassette subfamily C protein LapB
MDIALPSGLNILKKLVSSAGWHSNETSLFEAVPHMSDKLSPTDLTKTLQNLGVPMTSAKCRLHEITAEDCPALFIDQRGNVQAILDAEPSQLLICDVDQDEPAWQKPTRQSGQLVKLERFGISRRPETLDSFSKVAAQFRGLWPWLAFSSFMTNLVGLITPLLIMVIYDRVIPAGSVDLIISLIFAVAIALASDAGFRYARSSAVAHMGREVEHRLGLALFRKLLALPINQIQKSDVEQQISRFKQFEGLRDIFTGQVLTTLLDLPFTLLFLFVLAFIAPQVALLIAGLMVIFGLATWLTLPAQEALNRAAAEHRARLQSHVFETTTNQQAIHRLGLVQHWSKKTAVLTKQAARSSRISSRFQLVSQSFGQALMTIAGIGAIMLSTVSAINGDITFGALIAVMSLVWKILTPLQSLYSNASQISGFLRSKVQSDRVLSLPEETVRGAAQSHQKTFDGHISLTGVTHRHDNTIAYALSQITLDIEAGEFVVIGGGNSSGKSTLMNLICGLYPPSSGTLQLDGINLRQIPVDDLRRSITYAQPKAEFFYGTLFQNFRLASPTISEIEAEMALADMSLTSVIDDFPDGIHTRLTERYRSTVPITTLNALGLTRSLVRPGSVLLLNEPASGLDETRKAALVHSLRNLKGLKTIILATQELEHYALADRFIYLEQGRVLANEKGSGGLKKFTALANRDRGT